jgi:hypothetical protein
MMYYDNQTSVLDISKCLGVSNKAVFKKRFCLYFKVELGKRAILLQAHLKKA